MKVIMLQDVGGVGQRGKVIEVSDGYALNYLIPNGKAEQATPQKEAEAVRKSLAEAQKKEKGEAELLDAIRSLEGSEIVISTRATEKGGLFKAITVQDIARMISEQKGVQVPESCIHIERPVKETGEHVIPLKKDKTASKMRFVVKSL